MGILSREEDYDYSQILDEIGEEAAIRHFGIEVAE